MAGATRNGNGDYDILVTKHNKFGNHVWTNQYAGTGGGDDAALAMFVDAHCNLYVTGTVFTSSADTQDVIVINYDSAGTEAWDAENNCKKEGWNNSHISSYKYI